MCVTGPCGLWDGLWDAAMMDEPSREPVDLLYTSAVFIRWGVVSWRAFPGEQGHSVHWLHMLSLIPALAQMLTWTHVCVHSCQRVHIHTGVNECPQRKEKGANVSHMSAGIAGDDFHMGSYWKLFGVKLWGALALEPHKHTDEVTAISLIQLLCVVLFFLNLRWIVNATACLRYLYV